MIYDIISHMHFRVNRNAKYKQLCVYSVRILINENGRCCAIIRSASYNSKLQLYYFGKNLKHRNFGIINKRHLFLMQIILITTYFIVRIFVVLYDAYRYFVTNNKVII